MGGVVVLRGSGFQQFRDDGFLGNSHRDFHNLRCGGGVGDGDGFGHRLGGIFRGRIRNGFHPGGEIEVSILVKAEGANTFVAGCLVQQLIVQVVEGNLIEGVTIGLYGAGMLCAENHSAICIIGQETCPEIDRECAAAIAVLISHIANVSALRRDGIVNDVRGFCFRGRFGGCFRGIFGDIRHFASTEADAENPVFVIAGSANTGIADDVEQQCIVVIEACFPERCFAGQVHIRPVGLEINTAIRGVIENTQITSVE